MQLSLNLPCASLFFVVKYLALTGVTFQVVGVKVNLLIHKLMSLGLELEEFFAIHNNSSG